MPRALTQDYLHNFKFRAAAIQDDEGVNLLARTLDNDLSAPADSGFNSISSPDMSVESVEYREGMFNFTRKQPGIATVADVTFSRGVILGDSGMFEWFRQSIDGGSYRATVKYWVYHRAALPTSVGKAAFNKQVGVGIEDEKSLVTYLYEAFPIRFKPFGDLDATASDVSLQEMDVAYEYWDFGSDGNTALPATNPET